MVKIGTRIALAATLAALLYPAAIQAGEAEQAEYCRDDVIRLCASSIPDRGRIIRCMKAQRVSLSAGCRAIFDEQMNAPDGSRPSSAH
ncbi:hypothetical protein HCU64_13910 [Methylobacterium sp. C25]|uniref:hypothetical protein n=1 Tax=Methylobacterium sp. C25 TaxID=2721622 RepID=UPI001F1DFB58|nr:hypothetical protein [Methylobacterium sp. C25]MCE4224855.1 hypothetical protein [Methylobacterium sp. C25]